MSAPDARAVARAAKSSRLALVPCHVAPHSAAGRTGPHGAGALGPAPAGLGSTATGRAGGASAAAVPAAAH
jgi:hypothetical protein